ncbi:hypothetical protein, partial [Pseudonocardia lacus]|uniref:preprotein translocase subunit SecA n=1 Tax=Pseudonocardia lacus TaxID=2835865 RepID=UPI001BDD15BE
MSTRSTEGKPTEAPVEVTRNDAPNPGRGPPPSAATPDTAAGQPTARSRFSFGKNREVAEQRTTARYRDALAQVRQRIDELIPTGGDGLRTVDVAALRTQVERLLDGTEPNRTAVDCVATGCALVEAATGTRPRAEQIMGALAMLDGRVVEQLTGEGKTLAIAVAALAKIIEGGPTGRVQILLNRDGLVPEMERTLRVVAELMDLPDLTVATVRGGQPGGREQAYQARITIGAWSEFVFDQLYRTDAGQAGSPWPQGPLYRLVDEIDLLKEELYNRHRIGHYTGALTVSVDDLMKAAEIAAHLDPWVHVQGRGGGTWLTDAGWEAVGSRHGEGLSPSQSAALRRQVEEALAASRMTLGVDYVIENRVVVPIDRVHGDAKPGQRYSGGLHQALEYKHRGDGVRVRSGMRTVGEMTVVDLLRAGGDFGGATGTIGDALATFRMLGKEVDYVPPHVRPQRVDLDPRGFATAEARNAAAVARVLSLRAAHGADGPVDPVLLVAGSIPEAEALGKALTEAGVEHRVLTARQQDMANAPETIAAAGLPGAVTVATNVIGRGVDIRLGGDVRAVYRQLLDERRQQPGEPTAAELDALWRQADQRVTATKERLNRPGRGLHVIIAELPASSRVEWQARGRAGRQGEHGSSEVLWSLEDRAVQQLTNPVHRAPGVQEAPGITGELVGPAYDALVARVRLYAEAESGGAVTTRSAETPVHITASAADQALWNATRTAGLDRAQLAALYRGEPLPGATVAADVLERAQADARSAIDRSTTAEGRAALQRLTELIPQREQAPHRFTDEELAAELVEVVRLAQTFTELERATELGGALGMGPAELAATVAVAGRLLAEREAAGAAAHAGDREPLRLHTLEPRALQALHEYARGVPRAAIAEHLGVAPDEVGPIVDGAVQALRDAPGRGVRTLQAERDTALARLGHGPGSWSEVRTSLRTVEDDVLWPVEVPLWGREDRIEELIEQLPEGLRDEAYRALVGDSASSGAGITTISRVRGTSTAALRAAGVPDPVITAVRAVLGEHTAADTQRAGQQRVAGPLRPEEWTEPRVRAALLSALGLPDGSEMAGLDLPVLLQLAGFTRADALWAVAPDNLLDRARSTEEGLTEAEWTTLAAHASGALRGLVGPGTELAALAVLAELAPPAAPADPPTSGGAPTGPGRG